MSAQGGVFVAAGLDDIQHLGGLGEAVRRMMHLSMILPSCFLPQTKLISGSKQVFGVLAVHKAQVLGDAAR